MMPSTVKRYVSREIDNHEQILVSHPYLFTGASSEAANDPTICSMLARETKILLVILLTCLISQFVKGVLTIVCDFLEPHGYEWQTLNDDYLFAKLVLTWIRLHTFHHVHLWCSCLWHLNLMMPCTWLPALPPWDEECLLWESSSSLWVFPSMWWELS